MIVRPTVEQLQSRLMEHFPDALLKIEDQSHLHAGHSGAAGGAGHYLLNIQSTRFKGLKTIEKHRLVYHAVGDWMPDRVHALTIQAVEL
jgi:BolA family transcriptional regulator, general stress-responsive regulator